MFSGEYIKDTLAKCFQGVYKGNIGLKKVKDSRTLSQSAITCSKLTIETIEQGVEYVQS